MNQVTINQAYLFIIFILNGIFIGIIFDIFRILRKSFKTPNIVTYVEDALFWIISALSVIYSLFVFNNGEIRGYIFIGLALGVTLYMLFFSKTIIKISVKVIVLLKNIIYSIFKVIIYPLRILFNIAKIPFEYLSKYIPNIKNITKKCHIFNNHFKSREKLKNKEGF